MEFQVYDKTKWHLENGVPEEFVLEHFRSFLEWCQKNELLSSEGKEISEIVDADVSLYSGMFTERGNAFMQQYYTRFFIGSTREFYPAMDFALQCLK